MIRVPTRLCFHDYQYSSINCIQAKSHDDEVEYKPSESIKWKALNGHFPGWSVQTSVTTSNIPDRLFGWWNLKWTLSNMRNEQELGYLIPKVSLLVSYHLMGGSSLNFTQWKSFRDEFSLSKYKRSKISTQCTSFLL